VSAVRAIVLAGGRGERFGAVKQFLLLDGRPLIDHAIDAVRDVAVDVVAVLPRGAEWDLAAGVRRADGGATRLDSVRAGLAALGDAAVDDIVVVHDAAHPLAAPDLFMAVIDAVRTGADAAVVGVPLVDVTKAVDGDGWVERSLPKDGVVVVQMPQAFRAGVLRRAHAGAPTGVEDSEIVEQAGGRVRVVAGDPANLHVTTPEELALAEAVVRGRKDTR